MTNTKHGRDNLGRFTKEYNYWKGRKLSSIHKQKLSEAKKRNPVKYWLGKRRDMSTSKNWKGGETIWSNGYVYIARSLIEDDINKLIPGKRPVQEHIYKWVKHNQTSIPKGYHIHHINGIKTDNRIENLRLLKPQDHFKQHRIKFDHEEAKKLRSQGLSYRIIGEKLNVSGETIRRYILGR